MKLHLVWFLKRLVVFFIMAITKREFAAKLLFWLLPWPISRPLPRALRIYYFGPGGAPPPGFYDFWGTPGRFWPDPYNPPDDPFPDPGPGPVPGPWPPGPWPPGPGPGPNPPQPLPFFDNTYWAAAGGLSWDAVNRYWSGNGVDCSLTAIGTWAAGFRASYFSFTFTGAGPFWVALWDTDGNRIAYVSPPSSGSLIPISFVGYDIDWITFDGGAIVLTNIEFLG